LETSSPCRHRAQRAPAAAGARANLRVTKQSSGWGDEHQTTQLAGSTARGSRVGGAGGNRGGSSRSTIAAVVEAGRIREDGASDELPGEDGAGGGKVTEVGEEHHHLQSEVARTQAQTERSVCIGRQERNIACAKWGRRRNTPRSGRAPARVGRRRRPPFSVEETGISRRAASQYPWTCVVEMDSGRETSSTAEQRRPI
jgi:hypothetical protein